MNDTQALIIQDRQAIQPMRAQADNDDHLIDMWLKSKRSTGTREEYARDLQAFRTFTSGKALQTLRMDDLQNYAEHLAGMMITKRGKPDPAPLSLNAQKRKLATVKSLLAFGHRLGYLPFDTGRAVPLPESKDSLASRIMSEADVMRLIDREENPRNKLLLTLSYSTGGRVSEIVPLTWGDLSARENGGQATLYGKRQKTRNVLIPAGLWAKLQAIRTGAADDAPVFPSRWSGKPMSRQQAFRIVQMASVNAGIKRMSPHWLRHAHASHSLDRGAPVSLVSETLGHADLKTTSRYAHAKPGASSSTFLVIE